MILTTGCEVEKETEPAQTISEENSKEDELPSEEIEADAENEKTEIDVEEKIEAIDVDLGIKTTEETEEVPQEEMEEEQISAISLDENEKLIIGDIIQGVYITEIQEQQSLKMDEGKRRFLLCYRFGGHLEEILAPYNVDGYSLQMNENEINHLLDMAIGKTLDGTASNIADGCYINQIGDNFFLQPADIGDNGYLTTIDTIEQQEKEVVVTGEIYVYECDVITAYDTYSCIFEINEESIFAGLTLKEFEVTDTGSIVDKYQKFLSITFPEMYLNSGFAGSDVTQGSKFMLVDVNHDGTMEILIMPSGASHATGYYLLYAYVDGQFVELPLIADEFGMFGSGNIYVTASMHQGHCQIDYYSFDGITQSCLFRKYYTPYPTWDVETEDEFSINEKEVTCEEATAYEKQLLGGIKEKRCYYGGEILYDSLNLYEDINIEFVEQEKEWCNLEYQNVKEYLEAHIKE